MSETPPSDRARLRRLHKRGAYDRETVCQVLDAGCLCHVGYVVDGQPFVTPTLYWRDGDHVYWHGSSASRMLRKTPKEQVCLTVTHMDGFVLARSGFHHSANFRSVMLFGAAEEISGAEEKLHQLERFMEGLFPGRWATLRATTDQELKATALLRLSLDDASAKIRTGPPGDDEEDYGLDVWAGVLPVAAVPGTPVPCPRLPAGTAVPGHVLQYGHVTDIRLGRR